jgi:hypothetical protein
LFALLLLKCTGVYAQESWGSSLWLEQSKKLFRKIDISLEEEFRLRDDFRTVDRFSGSLDISYKPFKYLKAGGAYNLIRFNHEKKGWEMRHRYSFYATGSYAYKHFSLSLRECFQSTYRVGVPETRKRANPKCFMRSRLKLEYNIKKTGFEPYISAEFYKPLNDPLDNRMNKIRYTSGTVYKINKQHVLELFYRYTNFMDDDTNGTNTIGAGYSFKF